MRTQAVDREAYRGNRGWLAPPTGIGNGKILTGRSVGCWSDGTSEGAGPAKPSELHFLVEMTVDLYSHRSSSGNFAMFARDAPRFVAWAGAGSA